MKTTLYLVKVTYDEGQYSSEGIRTSIEDQVNLGESGLKATVVEVSNELQGAAKEEFDI